MRWINDFIRLFFPRNCIVCGTPLVDGEEELCTACLFSLPEVHTANSNENLVERRLRGRVPVQHATALLVFQRKNSTQTILHQIKYSSNQKLAHIMGRQLGLHIARSGQFDDVDIIVPVPLHRRKERRRGYNQSLLLCRGLAQTFERPIADGILVRTRHTESQTHKNRIERLENMKGVFAVTDPKALQGKHILLVDDVITTGATTEACYAALSSVDGLRVSIAALAVSGDT